MLKEALMSHETCQKLTKRKAFGICKSGYDGVEFGSQPCKHLKHQVRGRDGMPNGCHVVGNHLSSLDVVGKGAHTTLKGLQLSPQLQKMCSRLGLDHSSKDVPHSARRVEADDEGQQGLREGCDELCHNLLVTQSKHAGLETKGGASNVIVGVICVTVEAKRCYGGQGSLPSINPTRS